MRSKTKIVVLHLKELIYTGIFAALGILFVILLIVMFLPGDSRETTQGASASTVSDIPVTSESLYMPGIYTTTLSLGDNTVDIEVVVDENNINSIRLVNLSEAVTTMYPLIEPSFEDLISQILENQSLEGITYSDDNKYTSLVLMDAIEASLQKAAAQAKH